MKQILGNLNRFDLNKFLSTHEINVLHMAQSEHGEYISITLIYEDLAPLS